MSSSNNSDNNANSNNNSPPTYQTTDITQPGANDILCGRGGGTNAHPGNIKFRKLVAAHKLRYLAASKSDKPGVARDVVREWRAMDPPGRFLAKSDKSSSSSSSSATADNGASGENNHGDNNNGENGGAWHDVGDKKAREKASQCLRERNGAANEAVAALVKTVTASGEACPEDYATLMNRAAYVKAKNDLTIREQTERMRCSNAAMGNGGGNNGGVGNIGGNGGMGGTSGMGGRGGGGGGSSLFQEAFEPISLRQQRFSPGSGFEGNNNNNNNNMNNNMNNNNNTHNMEDDIIEAEIQRLLMQRQQQLMARRNNANNTMGNNNMNNNSNNGGGGMPPQAYMGEESVMREYEQLMRKQRELNMIAGKLGMGGGNGNIGGGGGAMGNGMGMMNTFNTNGMNSHMMSQASGNMLNPGMNNMVNMNNGMGGGNGGGNGMGGNGNNYGNNNNMSGSMQSNHNPDAAKDYMQRLRSLRQGGTNGGNNNNNMGGMMPDPLSSSSPGYGAYGNVGNNNNMNNGMGGNNNGLGLGGGNNANNDRMMNNMMNNMQQMRGNNAPGGRGGPEDFTIEEYQASLQQFLSHSDDFGGGASDNRPALDAANRMALEREMAAKGLANDAPSSSRRYVDDDAGGRRARTAARLEDGDGGNDDNADAGGSGSADVDMDIHRDTFKSVDSADRPSFQSFKSVDTMDIMRNTFKSVDTMDLMSIGNSINEIADDEVKQQQHHSEMRKKYGRRLSNASSSNRYTRGRHDNKIPPGNNNVNGGRTAAAAAAAATLSDFANLPGRTLEIKTLDHGNGRTSGGPKKIRKAIDPRLVAAAMAGRHSIQTKDNDGPSVGGRGSMLSIKDLNFDGVDDTSRMSFGNMSVMSELTDFQEMMARGQDSFNQL